MKKSLADALQPFGIKTFQDFIKLVPDSNYAHLRRVYTGNRAISRRLAERIKKHSDGLLTLDYLLSFRGKQGNQDGKKRK